MTAKEELLRRARTWTDYEAEIALRAVQREGHSEDEGVAEEWGDLSAFKAALTDPSADDDD